MVFKFLIGVFVIYLLICLLLYLKQELFIFRPTKLDKDYTFQQYSNFEEHYFPIPNGTIHALHFKTSNPKGIILYFHGNSQALESWGYVAEDFTQKGFDVFMPDYRAYGKSTGKLSEHGLNEDALMIYNFLKNNWQESEIIIYGRSLGSGIATELATKVKAKLVILETPYKSMPAMANKTIPFVPVRWLMRYQFRNISKMQNLLCPIHIFAATNDQLTPYQHAVALAEKTNFPSKNLTTIEGAGHGNISEFSIYHTKLEFLLQANLKSSY